MESPRPDDGVSLISHELVAMEDEEDKVLLAQSYRSQVSLASHASHVSRAASSHAASHISHAKTKPEKDGDNQSPSSQASPAAEDTSGYIGAAPTPSDSVVDEPWYNKCFTENGALVLVAVSAVLNSLQSVFLKFAKNKGVPGFQMVLIRAVIQFAFVIGWLWKKNEAFFGPKELRFILFLRGVIGGIGFTMLYHAVAVLPIGDATALFSLHPIFTVLFAFVFLREPFTIGVAVAVIASIGGMILISRPTFIFPESTDNETDFINATEAPEVSFIDSRLSGIIGALTTSVCAGGVMVLIRRARLASTAQQLVWWCITSIFASVVLGVTVQPFVNPPSDAYAPMCVSIFCGILSHVLMTLGTRLCPAGSASLVRATEILWSYLWQILIFEDHPPLFTFIGVGLDVLSLVTVGVETRSRARKAMEATRLALEGDDMSEEEMNAVSNGESGDAAERGTQVSRASYHVRDERMTARSVSPAITDAEFMRTRDSCSPIPI